MQLKPRSQSKNLLISSIERDDDKSHESFHPSVLFDSAKTFSYA